MTVQGQITGDPKRLTRALRWRFRPPWGRQGCDHRFPIDASRPDLMWTTAFVSRTLTAPRGGTRCYRCGKWGDRREGLPDGL